MLLGVIGIWTDSLHGTNTSRGPPGAEPLFGGYKGRGFYSQGTFIPAKGCF